MWSKSQQKDVVFAILLVLRWIPSSEGEAAQRQKSIDNLIKKISEAMEMTEEYILCALRHIKDPHKCTHTELIEVLRVYKVINDYWNEKKLSRSKEI